MRVCLLGEGADPRLVRAELVRRGSTATQVTGAAQRAFLVEDHVDVTGVPGISQVLAAADPHPRVSAAPASVRVGPARIGAGERSLIAGPCAVETEASLEVIARAAADAGASILRGGAYKPRTSPYAFQGLGAAGLPMLRDAARRNGLGLVTEAMDSSEIEGVAEHADMIQIGSRNMQNFRLLQAAGRTGKAVMLKRGAAATVEEWLLAAEYALAAGAGGVVLCERGIRGLPGPLRNTLDLGTVAWLLAYTQLPVVVDPSHATGDRRLVLPLARAAWALGAHGVMVEAHVDGGMARCDGAQALSLAELQDLGACLAQPA